MHAENYEINHNNYHVNRTPKNKKQNIVGYIFHACRKEKGTDFNYRVHP